MNKILMTLLCITTFLQASTLTIPGTVVSDSQKMIGSRYMGYVKKINFNIGDAVKQDDVLFELQSGEFDLMKSQAELGLEQAKIFVEMYQTHLANVQREKRNAKRSKSTTRIDIENLDIAAENTKAMLKAAQQVVKQATIKIKQFTGLYNYLEVKAPNDGVIVQKRIKVGDMIMPGMLAMVLVDLNDLRIEANIAESNLKYIRKNTRLKVEIPSIGFITTGVVEAIVPSANPMTHTMTIRVKFNKKNEEIFPGMYAKLHVKM
jgi:RND family efflux transporter MFP subunit